jgi:hypothetical protein
MYGFRVPFKAAEYKTEVILPWLRGDGSAAEISEKTLFIIAQVLGYTVSKFAGIKIISELRPERRAVAILVLIAIAEVALLMFAITDGHWKACWLFVNGLPLGMVFGLVLGFLEGRQTTEALTAGLCASFILADGVMKSLGKNFVPQVGEEWMPVAAGAIFIVPLCLFVWMLSRIPRPNRQDEVHRQIRTTLSRADRWSYLQQYGWGLLPIIVIYLLATIMRSMRGDFANELWRDLGVDKTKIEGLFTYSEIWVGLAVLMINGGCVFIRNNGYAFLASLGACALGVLILFVALWLNAAQSLSPFALIVMMGMGLYLPYVAVHTTVLERFIALTKEKGNLGFLMYLVDATGYLGYVAVLLYRDLYFRQSADQDAQLLPFFLEAAWWAAILSSIAIALTAGYYWKRFAKNS